MCWNQNIVKRIPVQWNKKNTKMTTKDIYYFMKFNKKFELNYDKMESI